jgi:MHS family proline/betaine transporter-like MFS transporter
LQIDHNTEYNAKHLHSSICYNTPTLWNYILMHQRKKVFFSAILGNILEYYDFTVYAVFSVVIGRIFFSGESELVQVLSSLGVFAAGFVTRPIGGILFGYIGDRYGRRIALICSMLGMTVPTFAIGLIPSYAEIGFYAPLLLVIMRLLQGLCVSGEGAGAAIFVLEHYGNLRPGFITGVVQGSNIAGTLLASFIGIIIESYFNHIEDAWRGAFLLGGTLGIVGFYLRLRVAETPIFQQLIQTKHTLKAPFTHVVKTSWKCMFITFCLGGMTSSVVYLVKTYIHVFFSNVMHLEPTISLIYLSYTSMVLMITMPCFGALADRFGKVRVMFISSSAIPILAMPILILMSSTIAWHQICALTLLGVLAGSASGVAYIFIISLFTPEQRFTGVAFSYNLGIAVFGGTSGMISRWLVETTSLSYAPAFYIITTALMFLVVMISMRKVIDTAIREAS